MAVPASVGYFFNTMYNLVDTYFGGQISTEGLAAALRYARPLVAGSGFFILNGILNSGLTSRGTRKRTAIS